MGILAQEPAPLIVVAPTAFKGTLSPMEAARAIARGVRRGLPRARILLLPVADGGDGTREVLAPRAPLRYVRVHDPLGRPIRAPFALVRDTAILEMADASGLKLLDAKERIPLRTTTHGTGQLLQAAFQAGARRVLLGVGGSATVDGGLGAIEAMDDPRLCRPITVLCDVNTRFLDAPRVFGPQKGATPSAVNRLERRLRALAERWRIPDLPGTGAAGGLAGGLAAHGARLVPGSEFILRRLAFRRHVRAAALVLTGEGHFDPTSLAGKAVGAVLRACGRIPCIVLCGQSKQVSVGNIQLAELAGSAERAIEEPAKWLSVAAEVAVRSGR